MSHFFPGHSPGLPRKGQSQHILLLISAGWTFVNEQWKTEMQCLRNSERTDAPDQLHSFSQLIIRWRHHMSLTVYDSFGVSNWNDGMGSSIANRRSYLTNIRNKSHLEVAFKTQLISNKLTWMHSYYWGCCFHYYYFEQEIIEECKSELTACIHEDCMFMRKALSGIDLLWPEIHHSWVKTMKESLEVYSRKSKQCTAL